MLLRRIGSFLRGNATPFQIFAACVLGALLGFAPPFADGPGLTLLWLALLLVLNANLMIAALVTAACRALAILLAPLLFSADRFFLDGPTQPLFEWLVNAPVLAWFGFDIYGATAGIILALVVGLAVGFLLASALRAFRRRMSRLEEGSERYKAYNQKQSVRLLAWLLVGKAPKKTYAELAARRIGNPIRATGVALVLLAAALLWIVQAFFAGPVMTFYVHRELERVNGATVDLEEVAVDFSQGRATIRGLAMADPNELTRDIVRAQLVEADLANTELLRRRMTVTRVEFVEASSGRLRARPGVLVGDIDPPPPPPGDEPSLEDYLREAEKWKERLTKLRDWLDRVSQPDPDEQAPEGAPEDTNEDAQRDRLEHDVRQNGYRGVRAMHLRTAAPALLIEQIIARGVDVEQLGEAVDVTAENISTQPWLVPNAPRVVVRSTNTDRLDAELAIGYAASSNVPNVLRFALARVPADAIAASLIAADRPLLSGGTVDLLIDGSWLGSFTSDLDVLLSATPRDTTLALPGLDPTPIDAFTLPIGLTGAINAPRVSIPDDAVRQALLDAGKRELVNRLSDQLPGDVTDKLDDALGEGASDRLKDELGKGLGGLLGGNRDRDDENNSDDQDD